MVFVEYRKVSKRDIPSLVAQPYSSEFYGEKAEETLKIIKNAVRFFKELLDCLNKLDEKVRKR